ncbi:MAG: diguanylate cyclase [Actinobacteria bacterium]|nr:diguanylate cyclase [Actinomycetota bacterium]
MSKIWGIPFFKRLSTKMVVGFVAIVAVFSFLGLLASRQINQMTTADNEAASRSEALHNIHDARMAVSNQIQFRYELLLEGNVQKIDQFKAAAAQRDQALAMARTHDATPAEQAQFQQMAAADAAFDNNFLLRIVPSWQAGDMKAVLAQEPAADALQTNIEKINDQLEASFQQHYEAARVIDDQASSRARSYLFFAAILGISLSALIGVVSATRLNRPLKMLKLASTAMTGGDLDQRVEIVTNDEFAELGQSFNMMADAIQHKINQLTRLSDIALAISSEFDWESVVDIVMKKGMELTDSKAAAIVLYNEQHGVFTDTYTAGLSEAFVSKMQFRPGGLADEVLKGDVAVFSDDVSARHRLSKLAREEGIRAFICLPLKVRQKKLGVFYVYSREAERYGRDELSILTILSNQAAIAIQNAQKLERSREEAATDGLTGLYNQRHFYERLKDEADRSKRNQKPLSVIFCDLDKFKTFNDLNGHGLGDKALKDVSRIISESKRAIDVAARYGGEEFALILPETDSSGAQIIAHRIRRRIAGFIFKTKARGNTSLSVSIGVASYPEDAASTRDLVDKADWAMYYGKRKGGNRVTLFHEESGEFGCVSLEDLVREELYMAAAQAIATAVDERNIYDKAHAESVARISSSIAMQLGLDDEEIHQVRVAGLLHDIGLISVPEEIINKRGRLSAWEWNRVKEHPEIGEMILKHLASLQSFLPLVRHHHEHYDGCGYPDGLTTDKIPLGARILSVADAYQAMTTDRPYRRALSPEQALDQLRLGAGTQFDPQIVDAFEELVKQRQAKAS